MPGRSPGPAREAPPAAVARLLEFVNTRADGSGRVEEFADPGSTRRWLVGAGLVSAETAITEADVAAVRELRQALVVVLLAHSGTEDVATVDLERAQAELHRAARLHPVIPVVTSACVTFLPGGDGVAAALGSVLAAVAHADRDGDWGRIKACHNPPCHFGFFDRTRNGSARYCSTTCGTQVSMRAYRIRRRSTS